MADAGGEAARQAALKRAGQEYFDRVLAGAVAGADPPGPAGAAGPSAARGPPTSVKVTGTALLREAGRTPSASRYSVQRAQGEARRPGEAGGSGRGRLFDQDLLALEDFLQGSKEWVVLGLFVLFTATSIVLVKSSTFYYPAPCFLLSLHSLPVALGLGGLIYANVLEEDWPAVLQVRAILPRVLLESLCSLLTISMLLHGSVYFLLCWTFCGNVAALTAKRQLLREPLRHAQVQTGLLGVAVLGALLETLVGQPTDLMAWLLMFAWQGMNALNLGWKMLLEVERQGGDPTMGGRLPGAVGKLLADENALGLSPTQHSLLGAGAAVAIYLVCSVVLGEARHLAGHELSVPTVTMILFSTVSWAGATCSRLMLSPQFSGQLMVVMLCVCSMATVVLDAILHSKLVNVLSFIFTCLSVLCCAGSDFFLNGKSSVAQGVL